MFSRPLNLRRTTAVLIALLGALPAGAQLTAVSPFLPAQAAGGPAAPTAGAPLEFRGTMEDRDGLLLRIVDPARKTGWWVRVNERNPEADFTVKQYDADRDLAVTEQQGRTFTLALREAKVVSSGSGAQMMAPPPPNLPTNVPPAVTNSVVVNPTPADEQRRLQAVADEVARRRQLREQAQQQVNPGAPAMPQTMPQPQPQNFQPQVQQQQGNLQRTQGARGQGVTIPGRR